MTNWYADHLKWNPFCCHQYTSLIFHKPCEIDGRFNLTAYRKPHIASLMVTWLMTSFDLKMSRLWPQNLSSSLLLQSEVSWLAFRTPLKTDSMHPNIRGVKMTPTYRRCNKIGVPVEGLSVTRAHSDFCFHLFSLRHINILLLLLLLLLLQLLLSVTFVDTS